MTESHEEPDIDATPSPAPPPRRKRPNVVAVLLILLVAGVVSLWAYNAIAESLAHRWDDAQERDEATGVILGAAHQELGPKSATTAVLLVHGFIGATSNFGDLPERLAESGYRVHVLRLPGHGTTPFELKETQAGVILDAVMLELWELKKNYKQVFIGGHSMGGALSTIAASKEKVDGLILAAPYFGVTHQWYYVFHPETWTKLTGGLVKWTYKADVFIRVSRREVKDEIVSYRWVPSQATLELNDFAVQANDPKTLQAITAPVLLLHSRDDFAASPDASEKSFAQFSSEDKTFVWLENSDHHVFWDHDREQVIETILEFIQTHAGA